MYGLCVHGLALYEVSSYSAVVRCLRTAGGVSLPETALILFCMPIFFQVILFYSWFVYGFVICCRCMWTDAST